MKKILSLILCTGVISVSLYGQSAFQDALQLRQLDYQVLNGKIIFTVKDSLRLAEICGKYVPNAEYYAQIELRFQNNPYIKLPSSSQLSSRGAMKTSGLSTFLQRHLHSMSRISQTEWQSLWCSVLRKS